MNTTTIALLGFIGWTLVLIVAVELARVYLVLATGRKVTQFNPDGADISPFMHRLARAHANCVENFPIFGGLLLLALLTNQTHITNPLAPYFLAARLAQSLTHLVSTRALAINIRFAFFAAQLGIGVYWVKSFMATI